MIHAPDTQKSHPWRMTVRRMNHPFPPLFDVIGRADVGRSVR
jgi:hypothetical protein